MRVRRLDEALIPFPVLAFAAGCMMTAGFTLYLTIATSAWARGVIIGMAMWVFGWTTRMISATTRFLYTHAREQAEAAERARSEATESQLAALQAQMNPHFLFNTLNTVASLLRTDVDAAEATVENLAVVLRRTLDRSRRVLSTVDDELDYLAAYLSVAEQRFENRLQVHWSIDPEGKGILAADDDVAAAGRKRSEARHRGAAGGRGPAHRCACRVDGRRGRGRDRRCERRGGRRCERRWGRR